MIKFHNTNLYTSISTNKSDIKKTWGNDKVDMLHTVFDLIGTQGAYVNMFSTNSAKRSSSGR